MHKRNQKMNLNKETIARLSVEQLRRVAGGRKKEEETARCTEPCSDAWNCTDTIVGCTGDTCAV